ncbi:hypothetical protein D8I35_16925 [Corticibacter populi]|uniref:Uncharacterized protein n=1 Tax=Corticibacter populi TaxID=1550736 RepID=A0A3M6QKC1_9BURK|nr:hypothetical protein [Corticibacter populi]RMX03554.1 hypothetical protein D8I35_16925 [Corticibacter populi]RZS30004.1 hypothetical protein EV687_3489 [Corticibacter populi]
MSSIPPSSSRARPSNGLFDSWLTLTPQGVLQAFGSAEPNELQLALQSLLRKELAVSKSEWSISTRHNAYLEQARDQQWVQVLSAPVNGPDTRLSDFIRHVIAPLSGERRAVLASESGFCLDRVGVEQDEAEALSAAAADFSEYARRQARRGWQGASRYVSFFDDPQLLLPSWSFVPIWVDGAGYWIIIGDEPLLNNLALVELVWGICLAGKRFLPDF